MQYEEIRALAEPADEWLTYSGSYSSIRHSALAQIGPDNVDQLAVRWIYQFPVAQARIETSPIVRSGVMFVTSSAGHVMALEAASGKAVWEFQRKHPLGTVSGGSYGLINRGAAILGDKLFVATGDAHLLALSADGGTLQWDATLADYKAGYFITGAPLVVRDLVVIGVSVQPLGRGFIAAYEASTGKERWRFYTIPGPGEPGHETWEGESWRTGGASAWLTGSYDAGGRPALLGRRQPKTGLRRDGAQGRQPVHELCRRPSRQLPESWCGTSSSALATRTTGIRHRSR